MDASSLLQDYAIHRNETLYNALLVGQYGSTRYPSESKQRESLKELHLLANTARIQRSEKFFFPIFEPNPRYFLTRGLLEKTRELITEKKIIY